MIGLVFAVAIGTTLVVFHYVVPTETEHEIQLDLASRKLVDAAARVFVLSETKLVNFQDRKYPYFFLTVCVRDKGQYHLAHVNRWRIGTRWRTDQTKWMALRRWPDIAQIRGFDKAHIDRFAGPMSAGYLPRPSGFEDFRVTHLTIQVSDKVNGYDPNLEIDPVLFATILRNHGGLNQFTFASFHQPRWFRAADGVASMEKSITSIRQLSGEPEFEHLDSEEFINQLELVRQRLTRAEELKLNFHFLARETEG